MSDKFTKSVATVQARGTCAALDGLTLNDNPYVISTALGRKWARLWLYGFDRAKQGIGCDACKKRLSKQRGYHYEYSNGFNYFLCTECKITDVKPPTSVKVATK